MRQFIANLRSEEGATATEYIFVVVFVAIALTFGMTALAGGLNDEMTEVGTQVETSGQGTSAGTDG